MWNALRLVIICGITYNFSHDQDLHEPLGQIVIFSILMAYGATWLLRRALWLLVCLLFIRHANGDPGVRQ